MQFLPILFTGIVFGATAIQTIPALLLAPSNPHAYNDTTKSNIIFYDDFLDNHHNWTVGSNKQMTGRMENGVYYLTANGHAWGEAQTIKIDTRKDFEIEASIRIVSGNPNHKHYFSMIFWGREGNDGYYYTFAGDGFSSVRTCSGTSASSCTNMANSFQHTSLQPTDFNTYTIRKIKRTYSFLLNGEQVYTMPFAPFFGNLLGFGAGRKVTLAVDYLKVQYI